MVQIIKKISLEVSKPNLIQAIVAKQYDNNSRFLQVTLMHEGKKIEIAPTSTVTINAKRTDGEEKSFAGEANNDGTATVPLTYWMLELEGEVWCDVSVVDTDGRKLSSTKFDLQVEKASCSNGDITEDENYDVLVKLIEDVNKAKPELEYDPTSENAQSGIAVEEAIKGTANIFANAIKGYASGEIVRVDDISPIKHNSVVWIHGKNIFNGELLSGIVADNKFNVYEYSTPNVYKTTKAFLKAGVYTISFSRNVNIVRAVIDGVWKSTSLTNLAYYTFETLTDGYVGFSFRDSASATTTWFDTTLIQIEKGDTTTDYEPYIDPTTVTVTEETTGATYTPNADGICEIVSVSPTMTLLTDTDGVVIECEYNKDTNKEIADVKNAIKEVNGIKYITENKYLTDLEVGIYIIDYNLGGCINLFNQEFPTIEEIMCAQEITTGLIIVADDLEMGAKRVTIITRETMDYMPIIIDTYVGHTIGENFDSFTSVYVSKAYVDEQIAALQAQIDELKK